MRRREVDLAMDVQALGLCLGALELQALGDADELDAVGLGQEIVVPPGATELAIGHRLQADRLLPGDELADLGILHRLQFTRRELARGAPGARLFYRSAAQQAELKAVDDAAITKLAASQHALRLP